MRWIAIVSSPFPQMQPLSAQDGNAPSVASAEPAPYRLNSRRFKVQATGSGSEGATNFVSRSKLTKSSDRGSCLMDGVSSRETRRPPATSRQPTCGRGDASRIASGGALTGAMDRRRVEAIVRLGRYARHRRSGLRRSSRHIAIRMASMPFHRGLHDRTDV